MTLRSGFSVATFGVAASFVFGACAPVQQGPERVEPPPEAPRLTSLSTEEASVGDEVQFYGENFVSAAEGWTDVTFSGTFTPNDGTPPNPVDLTIPLQTRVDGALVWTRFGGYRVPFLPSGNKLGVFEGTIRTTNHYFDPDQEPIEEQGGLDVTFHVNPSLVVLDNRAYGEEFVADCIEPSTVTLEMVRYAFRVQALGFQPGRFEFVFSEGLLQLDPSGEDTYVVRTEPARFSFAADGADQFAISHRWAPNPGYGTGYAASVSAKAIGVAVERSIFFPVIVRPWAFPAFEGPGEIAELLPPRPVSACIPGGPSSVQTAYAETTSETRTRSVSTAVSQDFMRTLGFEHQESYNYSQTEEFSETQSETVTLGETDSVGGSETVTDLFSMTNTRSRADTLGWSTEVGTGIVGVSQEERYREGNMNDTWGAGLEGTGRGGNMNRGFSISPSGSIGGSTGRMVGRRALGRTERRASQEVGRDGNTTTTASNSTTRGQNYSRGRTWNYTRSYEESVGFSMTQSLAQSQTWGQVLTASESVSESIGITETEIITQSSTESQALDTTANVWAGQFGTWYRQTVRVVYRGSIVVHDLCGNGTVVGQVQQSEWAWAPDLGIGDSCPPPTNLPPAECRIPPCQ